MNEYSNGTVARRGDIVSTKGGLYVVVDPAHDEGSVFLATVEPPLGYTRKAPIADCSVEIPGLTAKRIAVEVLDGFP